MHTTTAIRPPVVLLRVGRRRALRLALGLLLALLVLTALTAWGLWQLAAAPGGLPMVMEINGHDLLAHGPGGWADGGFGPLAATAGVVTGAAVLVVLAVLLLGLGLPLLLLALLGVLALAALVVGAPLLAALLVLGLVLSPLLVVAGVVWLVLRAWL